MDERGFAPIVALIGLIAGLITIYWFTCAHVISGCPIVEYQGNGDDHSDAQDGLDAEFSVSPETPVVGMEVVFDASPTNGNIESYTWEFEDGTRKQGERVTHTFQTEGTHSVTLTVESTDGEVDSETLTIRVFPQENIADPVRIL